MLGTLVDMAPSILIATPILLPVMQNFGVDPVHFGMIMLLNLGIGLCHPPVGAILFVGCAVGKVTIEQVMRKIWPFYGGDVRGPDVRHLYSRNIAVAAEARAALKRDGYRRRALALLFAHDLFGKPVSTFPDHALKSARKFPRKGPS